MTPQPCYADDTVALYVGDCREILPELGITVDLVLADPPGGLVLDPFAGSGSTLEAARLAGRRAIGIEIDERHAERAALRLAQAPLEFEASG